MIVIKAILLTPVDYIPPMFISAGVAEEALPSVLRFFFGAMSQGGKETIEHRTTRFWTRDTSHTSPVPERTINPSGHHVMSQWRGQSQWRGKP